MSDRLCQNFDETIVLLFPSQCFSQVTAYFQQVSCFLLIPIMMEKQYATMHGEKKLVDLLFKSIGLLLKIVVMLFIF